MLPQNILSICILVRRYPGFFKEGPWDFQVLWLQIAFSWWACHWASVAVDMWKSPICSVCLSPWSKAGGTAFECCGAFRRLSFTRRKGCGSKHWGGLCLPTLDAVRPGASSSCYCDVSTMMGCPLKLWTQARLSFKLILSGILSEKNKKKLVICPIQQARKWALLIGPT